MPYHRDIGYTRDQLIRDITFLFHECAEYRHIYGDNNYWSLLHGPYYEFFEEGESLDDIAYFRSLNPNMPDEGQGPTITSHADALFLQAGSVLLFYAMLRDWEQGSGYAFGVHGGECRHPLPLYVQRLLRAYRRVRDTPEHPTRPLYVATLEFLGLLDRAPGHDPMEPTELAQGLKNDELLAEVRTFVAEDELTVTEAQFSEIERALYDRYIRSYFAERAQSSEEFP